MVKLPGRIQAGPMDKDSASKWKEIYEAQGYKVTVSPRTGREGQYMVEGNL